MFFYKGNSVDISYKIQLDLGDIRRPKHFKKYLGALGSFAL